MSNVQHANVSVGNIHECKDANIASINTVRIADGSGSGSWNLVPPASITGVNNINKVTFTAPITDISTAGSTFVVCPIAGKILKIYNVIQNAITVADCGLTFKIATVLVTGGAITVTQSGSAAGQVNSSTPSAANTLTAGQAIEIVSDGNSSTTCPSIITFEINVA